MIQPTDLKTILCNLAKHFYHLGWATGTGGGISIRNKDKIYIAPSGVPKECLTPTDLFTVNLKGKIIDAPKNNLNISECTPLFLSIYNLRNAGAVIHSHSLNAVLITHFYTNSFTTSKLEMQKGIHRHTPSDILTIPIIENTEREYHLTDKLTASIKNNPTTHAILVRNHGIYIWGKDWKEAKKHAECYDYLFKATLEMRKLGLHQ